MDVSGKPVQSAPAATIRRGAPALLVSQALVVIAQLAFSAFTSRRLGADKIGAFVVGAAITGLIPLVVTVGLPSIVLSEKSLSRSKVAYLRRVTWLSSAAGAMTVALAAPLWCAAWRQPASVGITRILALQILLAPPAAIELALLRRSGRLLADAFIQGGSALSGYATGAVLVALRPDTVSLGAGPCLVPLMAYLMARTIQSKISESPTNEDRWDGLFRLTRRLSLQNALFYLYTNLPNWSLSLAAGSGLVGQYARAAALAGLPATTAATLVARSTQPFYRRLQSKQEIQQAVADGFIVSTALIALPFSFLTVLARPLCLLWLGPAWAQAASTAGLLALGFSCYAMMLCLAGAYEMLRHFDTVRVAQISMLLPGIILAAFVVRKGNLDIASSMLLAMSIVGLGVLLWKGIGLEVIRLQLIRTWLSQMLPLTLSAAVGLGVEFTFAGNEPSVLGAVALVLTTALLTFRHSPAIAVARRRGLIARPVLEGVLRT